MALKSGMLTETSWAIDVLNILLFDDTTIVYFGLSHLPGLLDLLLEHHRKTLDAIFQPPPSEEDTTDPFRNTEKPVSTPGQVPWWFKDISNNPVGTDDDIKDVDSEDSFDLGVLNAGEKSSESWRTSVLKLTRHPQLAVIKEKLDDVDILRSDLPKTFDMFEALMNQYEDRSDSSHIMTHFEWDESKLGQKILRHLNTSPMYNIRKRKIKTEPDDQDVDSGVGESSSSSTTSTVSSTSTTGKESSGDETGPPEYHAIRKRRLLEMEQKEKEKRLAENPDVAEVPQVAINDESGLVEQGKKEVAALDENYLRDEPCLNLVSENQAELGSRCLAISTALRNLSFVPGNDAYLCRSKPLLKLLSRVLELHHPHTNDDDSEGKETDQWKVDILPGLRENALVILANISAALELWKIEEEDVLRPLLDGVLHWAACGSVDAVDPYLAPHRLATEVLVKLSIFQENVDYILATPPAERIEALAQKLSQKLSRHSNQVDRELSINLVESWSKQRNMAAASSIPALIVFIEQVEQTAHTIANTHGVGMLRDNPEAMGTSLDMVRRAARALLNLSLIDANKSFFDQYEPRVLSLVCSQILDQQVAGTLANVLYANSPAAPALL